MAAPPPPTSLQASFTTMMEEAAREFTPAFLSAPAVLPTVAQRYPAFAPPRAAPSAAQPPESPMPEFVPKIIVPLKQEVEPVDLEAIPVKKPRGGKKGAPAAKPAAKKAAPAANNVEGTNQHRGWEHREVVKLLDVKQHLQLLMVAWKWKQGMRMWTLFHRALVKACLEDLEKDVPGAFEWDRGVEQCRSKLRALEKSHKDVVNMMAPNVSGAAATHLTLQQKQKYCPYWVMLDAYLGGSAKSTCLQQDASAELPASPVPEQECTQEEYPDEDILLTPVGKGIKRQDTSGSSGTSSIKRPSVNLDARMEDLLADQDKRQQQWEEKRDAERKEDKEEIKSLVQIIIDRLDKKQ